MDYPAPTVKHAAQNSSLNQIKIPKSSDQGWEIKANEHVNNNTVLWKYNKQNWTVFLNVFQEKRRGMEIYNLKKTQDT